MGPWSVVPVLGLTLALGRGLRIGAALGGLYAVSIIILLLFVGGLVKSLWFTVLIIHAVGTLLLLVEVRHCLRDPTLCVLPVTTTVLAVATGIFWSIYGNTHFYFYDEYAHWGIYLKELLASDAFWTGSTSAMHARYPPGPSLFQYFYSRMGFPVEGSAFLAQFTLVLTPMLILLEGVRWRQGLWIAGVGALILLAITSFSPGISSIYVDHVLGSWFAGCLLGFTLCRKRSFWVQALSALPLTTLVLTKGIGLALAFAAVVIMAAMMLHQARLDGLGWRDAVGIATKFVLVIACPALLCAQLWVWNRDDVGSRLDVMSLQTVSAQLSNARQIVSSQHGSEITRRFTNVILRTQIGNNEGFRGWNEFTYAVRDSFASGHGLTALGLIAAFAVWWSLLLGTRITGPDRTAWGLLSGGMLATALGYLASLYLMYLIAFGDRGVLLPSYTRYVNTIALSMLLVSFAPLTPGFRRRSRESLTPVGNARLGAMGAAYALALLALYLAQRPPLYPVLRPNPEDETRQHWEILVRQVQILIGDSATWVYLPDDDRARFTERVIKYLLAPVPVRIERSESFWRQDVSAILAAWKGSRYIWVPPPIDPDASIVLMPGASLSGSAGVLLRVNEDGLGRMAIEPAANPRSK